ncbi:hypothetical protein FSP39_011492 [Pinctada imbricata]|uniref:Hexosyltransferase n=1 Tax=Pinctada imbricata TaxID=66713 RepID=A0AA88YCD7_PINIB|nr:hypothetical protein FSP39_011492 [Pinctada imbricata]
MYTPLPNTTWIHFNDTEFRYPIDTNMAELAYRILRNETTDIRIINSHPFRYIHNPELLCSSKRTNSHLPLLILIKSSVPHFDLRNAIRRTWGRKLKKSPKYEMAFLLGYLNHHQHLIDNEHYKNGDIIQEDFIDAYWNNTYKTIMAYNWAVEYCSIAHTVLFLDDDMFINPDNLDIYVSEIEGKEEEDVYSGVLLEILTPIRDIKSKWAVQYQEYPYDSYPRYLAVSVMFVSMSIVQIFKTIFPYVKYLKLDDVYLGIVAHKLNIQPKETPHLDNANLSNFRNLSILIASHGFKDSNLYIKTYFELFDYNA